MDSQLPQLTVFSLGGTIASTRDIGGASEGVSPHLGAHELVTAIPELREIASIEAVSFRQVSGGSLSFSDLTELAREIDARFDAGVRGVVVTQGTDTIEETSFALDLLVRGSRPVVVTGAMRNPTLAGFDGTANLLGAVQVALSPQASGLGTLVVMNDQIHAARFVRKTHTSNPATFLSPSVGALGWIVEGHPRIVLRTSAFEKLPPVDGAQVPAVALLTFTRGDDARMVSHLESLNYAGLVVGAFGGGHVPSLAVPVLQDLATRMPVVLASRTGSGEVLRETYGFSGSERDLLAKGLISAGFLDGLKARIYLSLLLAGGSDIDGVRKAFQVLNASVSQFDSRPFPSPTK
jgi:L-asparaginase